MRADVVEGANLVVLAANHDHRHRQHLDLADNPVARIGNFHFLGNVQPAVPENVLLRLEPFARIVDVGAYLAFVHDGLVGVDGSGANVEFCFFIA